ncbi:MAG TPA: IS4 family transposase [Ramlibacter sp.]|nr:IS4 family transposase [Ramlibacter sp.]
MQGRFVFTQLVEHLPLHTFRRLVDRYDGHRYVKRFSCLDQFLCMAFAQLTGRESLRDIETCLRAHHAKLYHLGIRGRVARSTLADANEHRDWRIYADFAQALIATARRMYATEPLGVELEQTVYALDSSTIELCLSVFPWARTMHAGHGGIKLHTLLDVRGAIPSVIHVAPAQQHDVHMLDRLLPEPGAIYLMDRAYLDFARLQRLHSAGAFFIMRAKKNLQVARRYSHPVQERTSVLCDQTVMLSRPVARERYPAPLRRLRLRDVDTGGEVILLTNQFELPAATIGDLYRQRWQVEIFFKWIKQHLRIKAFFGTSANAVKTQVWIAVSVYVLIAIIRKRLNTTVSLYELLQVLSVTLFEQTALECVFAPPELHPIDDSSGNQLIFSGF